MCLNDYIIDESIMKSLELGVFCSVAPPSVHQGAWSMYGLTLRGCQLRKVMQVPTLNTRGYCSVTYPHAGSIQKPDFQKSEVFKPNLNQRSELFIPLSIRLTVFCFITAQDIYLAFNRNKIHYKSCICTQDMLNYKIFNPKHLKLAISLYWAT